jgi:hypothetical protein
MAESDEDRYRREAADASGLAERATSNTDRDAWRRISASWLSLIKTIVAPLRGGSDRSGPS